MSQENVELVRAVYVAFSALAEGGDITRYVKTFDALHLEYHPVEEEEAVDKTSRTEAKKKNMAVPNFRISTIMAPTSSRTRAR